MGQLPGGYLSNHPTIHPLPEPNHILKIKKSLQDVQSFSSLVFCQQDTQQ